MKAWVFALPAVGLVLPVAGAISLLNAADPGRPAPKAVVSASRTLPRDPAPPPRPEAAPKPVEAEVPTASPAILPIPSPLPVLREQPDELRQWLLQLPPADFGRLAGTRQMDDYVACIVGHLQASGAGKPEGPNAVGLFLKQLNTQILQAGSTVEPGR